MSKLQPRIEFGGSQLHGLHQESLQGRGIHNTYIYLPVYQFTKTNTTFNTNITNKNKFDVREKIAIKTDYFSYRGISVLFSYYYCSKPSGDMLI